MSADWTYKGKKRDAIPEQYEGFVYLITNTTNDKKYIGCLLYTYDAEAE